jgi:hypothetical protein
MGPTRQYLYALHLTLPFILAGILNLFNPCKPEGGWQLDLMRWEERQVRVVCVA